MITYRIAQRTQIGFIVTLSLALAAVATDADTIQIANTAEGVYAPYFVGYSAALDAKASYFGTTISYDSGIDHDLDTSMNPYGYAMVAYAELTDTQGGLHAVDYNFAPELEVGDSYTFKLGFENGSGTDFSNVPNSVALTDFHMKNSKGVRDYSYVLRINTDGAGNTYEYTTSGLLSEVWVSPNKIFAEWVQDFPQAMDWRRGRTYGELIITATSVPEPHAVVLFIGAGIFGISLANRRRKISI